MAKVIFRPPNRRRNVQIRAIDDSRWERMRRHLPASLSDEAAARLRATVVERVSAFIAEQIMLAEAVATKRALRRPGKRQSAPLDRLDVLARLTRFFSTNTTFSPTENIWLQT